MDNASHYFEMLRDINGTIKPSHSSGDPLKDLVIIKEKNQRQGLMKRINELMESI